MPIGYKIETYFQSSFDVYFFLCLFVCLLCQQELVEYYKQNTLGVSFPGLDTKLRRGVNEEHKGKGTDF